MKDLHLPNANVPFVPSRKIMLILFIMLFFAYSYVHQRAYRGQTPVSRLDLLHALFVHKMFKIDAYHENTSNKSVHEGHYYSDKAPGVVALALPAFSLAAGLLSFFGTPLDSDVGWLVSSWIACAGSLAIITVLGAVALFAWLGKWVPPRRAYIATLALFLGAAPLAYCTLMMSHGVVVGLLAIALWAGDFGKAKIASASRAISWRDVATGFCCGLALASEYSAGIVVIGILGWFVASNFKRVVPLALGALLPLMLIPAYHWICFGTPFTVAYQHEASFTQMHEGFFGIKFPNAESAFSLLFSGHRGLFFCSPVLLIAFAGYYRLYVISRPLFWLTYLVPLLHILAISGYFYPYGGIMFGPRFLAPLLAMMALPTALGIARFPRTGLLLASVSVLINVLVTVVDISPVPGSNPLVDFYIPQFIKGIFNLNLGAMIGLNGYASLFPLLLVLGIGICLIWRQLPQSRDSFGG
jgi:hypothetical protein